MNVRRKASEKMNALLSAIEFLQGLCSHRRRTQSGGEGCPLRIRGFCRCGHPNFLLQSNTFWKLWCAYTDKGGGG